jgi:hypothetical protein
MAAPAIAGSNRFIPEGSTQFYWVPTMANYLSPTRAELNAGTDLTPELAESGDWAITSDAVDTPDLKTLFTSQIPGKITVDGSTLNMYSDVAAADARSLMPRTTVGYVVKFPGGDIAGRKMTTFPVKVGSAAEPTSFGAPTTLNFTYYVTKIPGENLTVPA